MAVYLADKSALVRHPRHEGVRAAIEPLLLGGRIATCAIVDLEVLYSTTSPTTYQQVADGLRGMPRAAVTAAVTERALEVQAALAAESRHRAVTLPDLLVAACAEEAGLIVLHYDADFDRIASITGQPTRWVAPRGSVD